MQTLCVQDTDITDGNVFPDELEVDLDMLCMLVLNGVGGEVDGTDVVTIYMMFWHLEDQEMKSLATA
jgi:hypothetical protein